MGSRRFRRRAPAPAAPREWHPWIIYMLEALAPLVDPDDYWPTIMDVADDVSQAAD